MSKPAPAETRERIEKVLGDSADCALSLKDVLLEERNALKNRDTDLLSRNSAQKEACIRKLADLEAARASISYEAGFTDGISDMPRLTEWCDRNSVISGAWQRFMQIAKDCDDLNATNGAIIRVRQQQILAGIALLRGCDPGIETYGAKGSGTSGLGGRALTEA